MEFELRYRGDLLSFHGSRVAAEHHAEEHHGYGRAPGAPRGASDVEDPESLTIEPRRPVSLFCRGNLVGTFASELDAQAFMRAQIERLTAPGRTRPAPRIDEGAYAIVRGSQAPAS